MQLIEALLPFLIPIGILALLYFAVGRPEMSYNGKDNSGWCFIGGITATLFFILWVLAAPISYIDSVATIGELEAFGNETLASYEYTVDETERIILTDKSLTDFSTQAASERIAELRDKVSWYNETIYKYRNLETIPFIGAIIADVPDSLQPIVLPRQR